MPSPNELPPKTNSRVRRIAGLAGKAANELRDPAQALRRRRELVLHGRHMLSSILGPTPDQDTVNIENDIARTLEAHPINGATLYTNEGSFLPAVVFPDDIQVDYESFTTGRERDIPTPRFSIVEPTINETGNPDFLGYPTEGYRVGGTVVTPFKQRDDESKIQHGGIYLDADTRKLEILNYAELEELRSQELASFESIIEANWFMDSETAGLVCARPNLQNPHYYNVIGVLARPDGTNANFAISSYIMSVISLYNGASLIAPDVKTQTMTTMRHIAALSNLITRAHGGNFWAVCGLEYFDGGTYVGKKAAKGRFQITY